MLGLRATLNILIGNIFMTERIIRANNFVLRVVRKRTCMLTGDVHVSLSTKNKSVNFLYLVTKQ
jgi:hypothetical protein